MKLKSLYWSLQGVLSQMRLPSQLLRGKESGSGETLSMLYTGSPAAAHYWARIFFEPDYVTQDLGQQWIWRAISNRRNNIDISFVELHKVMQNRLMANLGFLVPIWIYGTVDLSRLDDVIRDNSSLKEDIRKMKKRGFEYEVTRDPDKISNFYDQMYGPYMAGRLGKEVDPEEVRLADNPDIDPEKVRLLLVRYEGQFVAGMTMVVDQKKAKLWEVGVLGGDWSYIKLGAIRAAYYFSILYVKSLGCVSVDLGGSRPLLNDGVLQYKLKWGMTLLPLCDSAVLLMPRSTTGGLFNVLQRNPMAVLDPKDKTLGALTFLYENELLAEDAVGKLCGRLALPGLTGVHFCKLEKGKIPGPKRLGRLS